MEFMKIRHLKIPYFSSDSKIMAVCTESFLKPDCFPADGKGSEGHKYDSLDHIYSYRNTNRLAAFLRTLG